MGKGEFSRDQAQKDLIHVYSKLEDCGEIKVCGSFRRGLEKVGDLDFVVTERDSGAGVLHESIKAMAKEVLANGQKIVRIILPSGIQADFYVTPERLFESHTLFLTGSKMFNKICRGVAKRMGCRLSQYGLLNIADGSERAISELDILYSLGMSEYSDPATRSFS